MTETQTVRLGADADQVLNSEAFKLAMSHLKTSVVQEWKACPVRDQEGALLLLQLAKLTDKFESILVGMVETGKLTQHNLDLRDIRNESNARKFMRRVVG